MVKTPETITPPEKKGREQPDKVDCQPDEGLNNLTAPQRIDSDAADDRQVEQDHQAIPNDKPAQSTFERCSAPAAHCQKCAGCAAHPGALHQ
jgi:hypothetical protein